jgi:PhzF family phenazine biosynthesis protein
MNRRFQQVDVFGTAAYRGNPLAVVLDAEGLDDAEMQRIANWTNLSETTFLLPPTDPAADYRVRIFTATTELPFAGHPTLGSCHAWLKAGGSSKNASETVQECAIGLVRVRSVDDRLAFAAPPLIRSGRPSDDVVDELADVLNLSSSDLVDVAWVDNGPGWIGLLLRSADEVLAVKPKPTSAHKVGIVGPYPPGSSRAFEVRGLFPGANNMLFEDPVTGSLNASLAQWLIGTGRAQPTYVAQQGTVLGRQGAIYVQQIDDDIWIGGNTITCIDGTIA